MASDIYITFGFDTNFLPISCFPTSFFIYFAQSAEAVEYTDAFLLRGKILLPTTIVYWPSIQINMPFQSDAPEGSYGKKSRRRTWLTKWDKVKSHDTLIDWCTGREWPLNCMTVISAWWWLNMPVQRRRKWHIPAWLAMRIDIEWVIELLYNSVRTGSQWVGDQMI